jgi:hypothetical protein
VRLRRSLQRLLRWILNRWKGGFGEEHPCRSDRSGSRHDRGRL